MNRRNGKLSAEDEALWRRVASSVAPIRSRPALSPKTPPRQSEEPASPTAPATRPARTLTSKPAAEPAWRLVAAAADPAPPDRGGERRVRRGQLEIGASLDLHGLTQDQARRAVAAFLARAAADDHRVVIIVTGKGRLRGGDVAPGVLKSRLPGWLAEQSHLVAGYARAHRRHGGEGAAYVFLRRQIKP